MYKASKSFLSRKVVEYIERHIAMHILLHLKLVSQFWSLINKTVYGSWILSSLLWILASGHGFSMVTNYTIVYVNVLY